MANVITGGAKGLKHLLCAYTVNKELEIGLTDDYWVLDRYRIDPRLMCDDDEYFSTKYLCMKIADTIQERFGKKGGITKNKLKSLYNKMKKNKDMDEEELYNLFEQIDRTVGEGEYVLGLSYIYG